MRWRDVRAALLLTVLVGMGVDASPLARSAHRKDFDTMMASDEFQRVSRLLGTIGVEATAGEVADTGFRWASGGAAIRRFLLAPLKPAERWTGTGQNWGLFSYPDRFPKRLVIESRGKGKDWTRLYAALDPDHDFLGPQLRYRRMRGVYDSYSEKVGKPFPRFCRWAADQVFLADPAATAVRVSYVKVHTFEPGEDPLGVREEGRGITRVVTR